MSGNDEEDAADLSSGLVANLPSLAKKKPVSPTSSSPRSTPPESPNKKRVPPHPLLLSKNNLRRVPLLLKKFLN